jgi:septal ring factor EnvC (AmiA/AmiB activator)
MTDTEKSTDTKNESTGVNPKEDPILSQADLEVLQRSIEEANAKLVSTEVQEQIKKAKEEAKKEAEKEMITNQTIKDLEERLAKKEKEKQELEKNTAEQLGTFKKQIDTLISSKAVVNTNSPFDKPKDTEIKKVIDISEDEAQAIEKDSFAAMLTRNVDRV